MYVFISIHTRQDSKEGAYAGLRVREKTVVAAAHISDSNIAVNTLQ
jgi:hypothetical protein